MVIMKLNSFFMNSRKIGVCRDVGKVKRKIKDHEVEEKTDSV